MKRPFVKLLFLFIIACIVAACPFLTVKIESGTDIILQNVEALASGETMEVFCYGSGSVDCYGAKVEVRIHAR